jgi:diaminohydroxyphosphoribosylaminopyrimidine deaminase/5-amino-6-(5-phosphoribosylamino)uracil reductase
MKDPNPSVAGGGGQTLRENGILVSEGILEERCRKLNEEFIHFVTCRTPFVTLKSAATLDGKIATRTGDSQWITGETSRRRVHRLRGEMDAVMVGIGTALKDDPLLTCRLPGAWRQPLRIVMDTHLRLPLTSNLAQSCKEAPLLIVIGPGVPAEKREAMAALGIEILELPLYNKRVDLNKLMISLGKRLITSVLLEGGSKLNASALAAGIVQKVLFFYAAKILGGQDSLPMIGGPSPGTLAAAIPLKSCTVRRSGEDFLVEGYVEKTDTG